MRLFFLYYFSLYDESSYLLSMVKCDTFDSMYRLLVLVMLTIEIVIFKLSVKILRMKVVNNESKQTLTLTPTL
jgi:hypothetical protein